MKTDIVMTMTIEEAETLRELIDLTANMGTYRSGDRLQMRDEQLLQKIYDRGIDVAKNLGMK